MASAEQLAEYAHSLETRAKNWAAKARERTEETVGVVAVLGGAALAGYMDGRYPDKNVVGVSLPIVFGGVATIAGLGKYAGKHSDAIMNIGAGLLGSAVYTEIKKRSVPTTSGVRGWDNVGAMGFQQPQAFGAVQQPDASALVNQFRLGAR